MLLSQLDNARGTYKILLLQTSSDKLEMKMYDKLRDTYRNTKDTIFEVKDKKDLKKIKEVATIDPFLADKWLVTFNFAKQTAVLKELLKIVAESNTMVLFCTVNNYGAFKNFQEEVKKAGITEIVAFYLNVLRSADFRFLYDKAVTPKNKLTKQLYDFVYQSYNGNIPAVMELFDALSMGREFSTRTEIAETIGIGGNSVENFIYSLLKPPSTSDKGLKVVLKNRIKAGLDLLDTYKIAQFQNYMRSCISCFIDLKMLSISGVLHKKIFNLPEGYNEKKLIKYQRFFWRIKEIPMTRILRLSYHLENKAWTSDLDFLRFIYGFVLDSMAHEVVPFIPETSPVDDYVKQKELENKQKQKEELEYQKYVKEQRIEYIKRFGLIRGRELFNQEIAVSDGKLTKAPVKRAKSTGSGKGQAKTASGNSNKPSKPSRASRAMTTQESVEYFKKFVEGGNNQ